MDKRYLFFIILFVSKSILAQGLFENSTSESNVEDEEKPKVEINGYVRGSAYGGSEKYDFANQFGEIALKGKISKDKTFFFADFRVREGIFYNQLDFQPQIKEVYAGYRGERIDVYLGNQIVSWGRTDGFNPTNNITPNDFFFLTYEPDDQLLPNFLLRSKFRLSKSIDFELITIPYYYPSTYRYDLFSDQQGVNYSRIDFPDVEFGNTSLAAKLNFELSKVGFSLSYFNGYDPFYGFTLVNYTVMPLEINYTPKPYRKQTIGFDFALLIKSFILRGEAAYNLTKDYELSYHTPNPDVYYVMGIEKGFFDITAILQYIGRYTINFKELDKPVLGGFTQEDFMQYANEMIPYESEMYNRRIFNQHEETNHALMLSLNRSFFYEVIRVELSGYYNFTNEEYLVHSKLKWNITDDLSVSLGSHHMIGPDNSIFDMSGKVMNGVFTGMEFSF